MPINYGNPPAPYPPEIGARLGFKGSRGANLDYLEFPANRSDCLDFKSLLTGEGDGFTDSTSSSIEFGLTPILFRLSGDSISLCSEAGSYFNVIS